MQKYKPLIYFFVVVVAIAILITALLYRLEQKNDPTAVKIGVSVYKGTDTFILNMMNELKFIVNNFEESTGKQVDLNIVDAQENQMTQNRQVDRFISLGYDVLVINLVERTEASTIIDKAKHASVPIVFFNREPGPGDMQKWDRLFYIGSDAYESAALEAQIVIDQYNKDPNSIDFNGDGVIQYIMLEGELNHNDSKIRTEHTIEVLQEAGVKLEKLASEIADWDLNQADAKAYQLFQTFGDEIELVICNNDDMAVGVTHAVDRLGLAFTNIVGIDGTDRGKQAVDDGLLLGTVDVCLPDHAQTIFDLAYALSTNTDIHTLGITFNDNKSIRIPMRIYLQHDTDQSF